MFSRMVPPKQVHVLLHDADGVPQRLHGDRADVDAVDLHRAARRVVEPRQERAGGGLAAAARPHERHGRTRRHVQVQAAQDLAFAVVAEMHVAVAHVPAHVGFPLRSTTGAHRARGAYPWQPLHAALFAGCALRPLPPAFGHRQVHGVGRVGDVGPHGQHLHEAPEARVALLELFGEVDQLLDGRQEDADVQGVDGQVGHRQASRGHEVAAAHDGDRVQHARER